MYHQLNSYHLGTNRAVFYVLPRPHIVQLNSENPEEIDRSTFVDGPRLLEGVQEFFLVVLRPDHIKDICVDAYLETAHIFQEKLKEYRSTEKMVDEFVVNGSLNTREGETEVIENEETPETFGSGWQCLAGYRCWRSCGRAGRFCHRRHLRRVLG